MECPESSLSPHPQPPTLPQLRATNRPSPNVGHCWFSIFYLSSCFESNLYQDPKLVGLRRAGFSQRSSLLTWHEVNTLDWYHLNPQENPGPEALPCLGMMAHEHQLRELPGAVFSC